MDLTHKEIFERYVYATAITRNPNAIAELFTEDSVRADLSRPQWTDRPAPRLLPGAVMFEHHAGPRDGLRHVYWIGGASGAGKSTIARRLAHRYGLALYDTDAVMSDHARRTTPEDAPRLAEFIAMSMDERWVNRSPETMLETFHWYHGEAFGLIVDDLLGTQGNTVAEGFRLLPHLVKPLLNMPNHAVWLIPTPPFRRAAFESRGTLWKIAHQTGDPAKALHNLLERDRLFTERLRAQAKELDLPIIEVDGTLTEDDLLARVAETFGL